MCVPKQITRTQLKVSHLSFLARWPEGINPVSGRMAVLHLSCFIHVTHRLSVYPLPMSIASIKVSAELHSSRLNSNKNALRTSYIIKILKHCHDNAIGGTRRARRTRYCFVLFALPFVFNTTVIKLKQI